MSKTYFITGANRGLGLGLVTTLLQQPNTTIIATVRSPSAAEALQTTISPLPRPETTVLHILPLDLTAVPNDLPSKLSASLSDLGITQINTLICNAGHIAPLTPATQTTAPDLRASFETNTIAPLLTFQACFPLMQKVEEPKFVLVSSSVGSIAAQEPVPGGAYGPSKAAANWLVRALHVQNEGLIALALHPGWVRTRAGEFSATEWGVSTPPLVGVQESVRGMLGVIGAAGREQSGRFVTYTGEVLEW
ncbi:hypothetical protein BDV25DRAFT_135261 [Aspergillus avenaceus]|uniref:NAD(P)-binding protein n=1 Tax=Aspergillus avenaceus TaxID=36643 RepID=A0A5N6U9E0_ASPAV|nr:hypothetical protein BDV25DRAFT_135261 [Aspergillus avenaceus]